jgi:hypothetical protein
MAKKGKTPSLIGGGAGKSKFVTAERQRTCRRCDNKIPKGERCVEVQKPGQMGCGGKPYCIECYREVLAQSQKDLNDLLSKLN